MPKKYLVIKSFYNTEIGSRSEGDVIELNEEQAQSLKPFIVPAAREQQVETADAPLDQAETADIKPVRKGRARENTAR